MKVKLLTSVSGANGAFAPGDLYECSKDEAARFIAAGFAEKIQETKKTKQTKKKESKK